MGILMAKYKYIPKIIKENKLWKYTIIKIVCEYTKINNNKVWYLILMGYLINGKILLFARINNKAK